MRDTPYFRLLTTLLLLGLLLCGPCWAAPDEPAKLDAEQQRLLSKSALDLEDIEPLIRLNQAAAKGYALSPQLRIPENWGEVIWLGNARMQIALLLENYEALLRECERGEWLLRFATELEKVNPPTAPEQSYLPWVREQNEVRQALQVFARRKLRLLDPQELVRLEGNPMFEGADNTAELDLLTARAYLDQGDARLFQQSLDKLAAYAQGPTAAPALVIGYLCLARHGTTSPPTLESTVKKVLAVGQAYRPGVDAAGDAYWISAGDELVHLARDLLQAYGREGDPVRQSALLGQIVTLNSLAGRWFDVATNESHDLFQLTPEVVLDYDAFQARQGLFALYLTSEKTINFIYRYRSDQDDSRRSSEIRAKLASYEELRQSLRGFWLEGPQKLFPPNDDFWNGGALHRLDIGMKVLLWKLQPNEEAIPSLIEQVLSLSPQEEALELAVDWSESLHDFAAPAAFQLLTKAEKQARDYRFPAYALLLSERRVLLLEQDGNTVQAIAAAEAAIAAAQSLVTPSTPVPGGRTMGDVVRELSEFVALRRLQSGETASALQQLDQGQALQSAYQLSRGATRSGGAAGSALQEVQQAQAAEDRYARGQAIGSTLVATGKGDFLSRSRELQSKYPDLYDRTLSIKPVEFPRLQKHLPDNVALLQYFPTESALYVFVITQKSLTLKQVQLPKAQLDSQLMAYLRSIRKVDKTVKMPAASRELYDELVAPVEAELQGKDTLLLIPTGRLNYLPFASLLDSQSQPLAATHKLATLGKSSDLMDVLVGAPGEGGSMMVLADPAGDLPAARQEGEALAALFPGGVKLFAEAATRAGLEKGLADQSYLHLATHGEIDPADPGLNYLLLAGGQKLTADDIFALPMENVQMVTLSACNTALGTSEPTASVVSLAESFWVTGPDSVVATLWAVNDESTAVFMQAFYKALQAGSSKAEAMQHAQAALRNTSEYAHPYYWSPFVLLGDWR